MLYNMVKMSQSRATLRSVSDKHLVQEVEYADVFHSETPSFFERFQPVGLTAVPLPQDESLQQQQTPTISDDNWNHNQPIGDAAEALMIYPGANRAHPIAAVTDDRRVRPYAMKAGQTALYAADGSEQMVFIKDDGIHVVSLDGGSHGNSETTERMASMRHVSKDMQSHKIQKGETVEDYSHEGKEVNTEVRATKDKIEIFAPGDKLVASYDKSAKKWTFDVNGAGTSKVEMTLDSITITTPNLNEIIETAKFVQAKSMLFKTTEEDFTVVNEGEGSTKLGLEDPQDTTVFKVLTVAGPAKKVWAKV